MASAASISGWAPRFQSVLRIVAGLLILQHGAQKILGFPPGGHGGFSMSSLSTLAGWSGPIELVGGVLIVLGLFSRLTAFILSGFTAAAYWMAHAPQSPYPINNGGELAALYCFVFLYLVFAGPGPWSLDNALRGGRR